MHCNFLPCDHLPLEIQLKPAKAQRQTTAWTYKGREQPNPEADNDSDDDDGYGYYQLRDQPLPGMQPQVNTDREDADRGVTQLSPTEQQEMIAQEETLLRERQ